VLQATDYYAFGLEHTPLAISNTNRYLYNGKELQDETFAGGVRLGWYDYGARMFDPQLGVFHTLDPMAVFTPGISPYAYACDNPVLYIDEYGMGWFKDLIYGIKRVFLTAIGFTHHRGIEYGEARNVYYTWDHKSRSRSRSANTPSSSPSSPPQTKTHPTEPIPDLLGSKSALLPIPEVDVDISIPRPNYGEPVRRETFTLNIVFPHDNFDIYAIEANKEMLAKLVLTLQEDENTKLLILGNMGTEEPKKGVVYGDSDRALNQPYDNSKYPTVRGMMNARAKAVYDYLVKNGIAPDRLKYGPGKLKDNPSGRNISFIKSIY